MWKYLSKLQKNLIYSIPASMTLGIIYGYFRDPTFLKSLIMPLTFLMVYPMMVNLQIRKVFSKEDLTVQAAAQVLNFLVIPFIAYGLGRVFFSDNQYIALGLLLAALLPTGGMTISWTGFAKGNVNAAIKMTVVGLFIGSLATPLYVKWLMGTGIEMPILDVFKQIFLVVFLPMVAGNITKTQLIKRYGEKTYTTEWKKKFPLLSTLGVMGIVFVAMALKSVTILREPLILVGLLVPIVLLYGSNLVLSTMVGRLFFKREDGIALVYGTVTRNLSIALAIAMTVFGKQGSDVALIIALAYIIQVQAAAWYVKYIDRIFGPPKTAPEVKLVSPTPVD
ncbi:MAG: bile acid:sodium symporter [Candidatus Bathyarchaeota archaeon]|nr:bile acid:sodium symporter [Candidatus Bathyarchaeota archaeon]